MTVLAIDIGLARVGVALSEDRSWATALCTLDAKMDWVSRLLTLVDEHAGQDLVVGLPLSLQGTETLGSRAARRIAKRISEERKSLKVHLWDERGSTQQAMRGFHAAGRKTHQAKDKIDAAAAVIILESWLQATQR